MSGGDPVSVTQHTPAIVITDDSTRSEIEEAIANVLASKRRLGLSAGPKYDDKLNALIDDWTRAT